MMRDRYSTITLQGRTFTTIIAGDDKHDWRLADPREEPEFARLWEQMRVELGYAPTREIAA
jgi:metallophosphoesterase superfamily enzyme